jgi:CRISPR-associated protein Csx10
MTVLSYRVTLLGPVLVTALEGDPNSAVAFDYLPGSALRGVLIGAYLRQPGKSNLDAAADPTARRLFLDATTRFLNAYPLDRQKRRSLPTPQSWYQEKDATDQDPVYDLAVDNGPPLTQPKGLTTPFCTLTDVKVRLLKPDRHIAVHTLRNRRKGRPGPEFGAIYRYEALAPEQTFGGVILCNEANDATTLQALLKGLGEASLGGSRSAGYGRVRFHEVAVITDWREAGPYPEPEATDEGLLVVTLLSDMLLRDGNGQFVADPAVVTAALSKRLGVSLTLQRAFLRGSEMGGFNRKWGLPLPQAMAVQMGSVFVYEWPDGLTANAVQTLEWQGLGERRAEGLGRVGVNWHTKAEWEVETIESGKPPPVDLTGNAEAVQLAQQMTERLLRQQLDRALAGRANELGSHVRRPSNSQLSRLRNMVREALQQPPDQGREKMENYLNDLGERQSTRKQFTRDRVAGTILLDWLRMRVEDEQQIWDDLKVDENNLPAIGTVRAERGPELAYEYNLRLIDAVLARAMKERGKENGNAQRTLVG